MNTGTIVYQISRNRSWSISNHTTESTNPHNKPGIIIRGDGKGTCMFIDVAISGERNVIKKKLRRF
jgi:hypothetical protein